MARFAKILIMLLRALSLVAIVLGILIWTGNSPQLLSSHIALGFTITLLLAILAILALAKRAVAIGIMGIAAAILLPWIGLKQFPLLFRQVGLIQIAHIVIVLAALGIAEGSYAAIRKAS